MFEEESCVVGCTTVCATNNIKKWFNIKGREINAGITRERSNYAFRMVMVQV